MTELPSRQAEATRATIANNIYLAPGRRRGLLAEHFVDLDERLDVGVIRNVGHDLGTHGSHRGLERLQAFKQQVRLDGELGRRAGRTASEPLIDALSLHRAADQPRHRGMRVFR